MHFKDLTLNNIASVTDDELLEMVHQTFNEIKTISFIKEEKNNLAATMVEPNFDDLKKEIEYKDLGDSFLIRVPVIDEQDHPHYRVSVLSSNENFYDRMPPGGAFVKANSRLIIKAFGLVDVLYEGSKTSRKPSDFRYLHNEYVYRKIQSFYYDFDEQKYFWVDEEDLNKTKYSLAKDSTFDLKTAKEQTQIYIEREKLTTMIKNRLKATWWEYDDLFMDFKNLKYDVFESEETGKKTEANLRSAGTYLKNYKWFIENHLVRWLKVRLLFSDVTLREYEELIKKVEELNDLIVNAGKELNKMANLIYTKTKADPLLYNWNSIEGGTEEAKLRDKFIALGGPKDILEKFVTPRPEDFKVETILEGFIGYDLNTGEVFPNLGEIERRRYRTENHSSYEKDEQYGLKIINHFKAKGQE